MNKDNVTLYVCAHRKFDEHILPNHPAYKILYNDELNNDNVFKNIKNNMSETYHMYYINKFIDISTKYIGINHYRRIFNFKDDIPNLDEIFAEHDIILPSLIPLRTTMYIQWIEGGDKEYADLIIYILINKYPHLLDTANYVFNNIHGIYANNMFIMSKENYKEMCDFIFPIIEEANEQMGYTTDEILDAKYQFGTVNKERRRLPAHAFERLFTLYVVYKFKNPYFIERAPILIPEEMKLI